jgi:2-C-methyl-D-erythritol 4-phosphate cytidylyltransferase / 2-C-methyl-D-erythritol 2,4-cyclodiphosphate synthase
MKVGAVILAAGKSTRFGGDKVWSRLGGKPVWRWSFEAFLNHPQVDRVVLVCPPGEVNRWFAEAPEAYSVVSGGETRQRSCMAGVRSLDEDCDIALIQDAARPFVTDQLIESVLQATIDHGGAAPAVPVADTLRNSQGVIVDRDSLSAMQTPQGVRVSDFIRAGGATNETYTDDIAILTTIGLKPMLVPGDPKNFKITTEDDLLKARGIAGFTETRTGLGYDIHPFSTDSDRPLMIGGVQFEGYGLEGHSDADALLHAVVDAILGAAGLGDIGQHFPNTDPRWKDKPSLEFLIYAAELIREHGWKVVHIDATVVAEKPKIMAQAPAIRQAIAGAVGCSPGRVSVKATTNERLGSIGREEGLAAFAVATIREA